MIEDSWNAEWYAEWYAEWWPVEGEPAEATIGHVTIADRRVGGLTIDDRTGNNGQDE